MLSVIKLLNAFFLKQSGFNYHENLKISNHKFRLGMVETN